MPQYAVLIYADDSAHAPDATSEETASCDQHADELATTSSMVLAYALTPRTMATSLRAGTTTDGPFVDAEHVVAGFYVLEAPDLETALAIARTNPVLGEGGGVEVRPVHSGGLTEGVDRSAVDRRSQGVVATPLLRGVVDVEVEARAVAEAGEVLGRGPGGPDVDGGL